MKQRGKKRSRKAFVTSDSSLLFVIRIGGWVPGFTIILYFLAQVTYSWGLIIVIHFRKSDMHPRTRKLLYSLRLRKIFSGVFVKANARILEILQKVEPYVTYG